MPRPKKDNTPISIRVEKEIYDSLEKYCQETGMTKTASIEQALKQYLKKYEDSKEK